MMRSTQHRGWPKKNGVFRFLFVNAIEETRIFSGGPNQFLISVLYTMQKEVHALRKVLGVHVLHTKCTLQLLITIEFRSKMR